MNVEDAIDYAGRKTAQYLTQILKEQARKAGWPDSVVNSLWVEHSEGSFVPQYLANKQDEVFVLEYGDETHPPNPVLRPFANRSHTLASNIHEEYLALSLLQSGVLI